MALYEYACSACGHRFERIMKRGARAPRCPECGGATKRQISAPAIHFKGTGWYVTDYAGKGKTDASAGRAKSSESKSEKSDTKAKKDAKPAAGKSSGGKGGSEA